MTDTLFQGDGVSLRRAPNGVMTLLLERKENLINPEMVALLSDAIAVAEAAEHPKALVVTASGKFFSNGLDVGWMSANPKSAPEMIESFWRVLGRILVMDCRTVAAINGHGFGAGIFLGLACDWRVMRTERGFVNFPELNLGLRLSKGFAELAMSKLTPPTLREGVLAGRRYGSSDALKAGIVDSEVEMDRLMVEAERVAEAGLPEQLNLANFNPTSFSQMKMELYTDAYRALTRGLVAALPDARL